MAKIDKQIGQW